MSERGAGSVLALALSPPLPESTMRGLCLALTLLACLVLTGCPGTQRQYKYRIAVIPKGMTHEFWQSIERGARRAAADLQAQKNLAVEIIWQGPNNESNAEEQRDIIDRQLAAGIHGLVLAPQHSQNMVAKVKQARDKG